ncbi:Thioesterase thiol ester dehydrase-isomerase [Pyrrhoderma noxium]|uniref:Thioesterase thiol ester dehydrase-isomerase n=1 Tax=Pyrrhoderma noxium TaxID=2282107 RepID=A0A286UKE6_9AGAM|nr:Thioesterase thiol ester dehydrase-isomerase [Pyrrhoderma noxium]
MSFNVGLRAFCVPRQVCWRRAISSSSRYNSIDKLQASFRDPNSPFYLAPGTSGPSSPGEGFIIPEQAYTLSDTRELHTSSTSDLKSQQKPSNPESNVSPKEEGKAKLIELGFDPESFYEQKVVWGDMDSFQHVNNVRYIRYLESARIHWMQSLALELGGEQKAHDMIKGKGVSLILGELSIKYRRPVVYPDTLLIAHRPHDLLPTHFKCAAAIWSYSQRTIVSTSNSTLVWYNYDTLKKCDPGEEAHSVLKKRIRPIA